MHHTFCNGYKVTGTLGIDAGLERVEVSGTLDLRDNTPGPPLHFLGCIFPLCDTPTPTPAPPPPHPTPTPTPPPTPTPTPTPAPATSARDELFAYVLLRHWPQLDAATIACCFAQAPATVLGKALVQALTSATSAAETVIIANDFIAGKGEYAGLFVADPASLPALDALRQVPALVRGYCGPAQGLPAALSALFHCLPVQMPAILASKEYTAALDRLWQSYFAVLASAAADTPLLTAIGDLLLSAHWLDVLFPAVPAVALPDQAQLDALFASLLVLPAPAFPLPPARFRPNTGVTPLAVGELQMVRHHFLRHQLGELAQIDNVMPFERKQVSRKRLQAYAGSDTLQAQARADQAGEHYDEAGSLQERSRQAIAEKTVSNQYKDFETSYGPPTEAKLNGNWTEATTQGSAPGSADVTRFARDILARSLSAISRDVTQSRSRGTLDEAEESVTSVIDNTHGGTALRFASRWVERVYQASVDSYGQRLMIGFTLAHPAADFLRRQRRCAQGGATPAGLGLTSFAIIDEDNYAALAATYNVTDLTPPPAARGLAALLRGGEQITLSIPDGYAVTSAVVSWFGGTDAAQAPPVLVGSELFTGGSPAGHPRLFGQQGEITVLALAPPAAAASSVVQVRLACTPTATLRDAWRIQTYDAIVNAYRRQLTLRADDPARNWRSPRAARRAEQAALRRGCLRLLLNLADAGLPAPQIQPDPFLLQFLHHALEWREMSVRYDNATDAAGAAPLASEIDAGMCDFLDAELASVLVPADPALLLALLYFLASGRLWQQRPAAAPVHAADLALVHAMRQQLLLPAPVACWEVTLPTTMQALDPHFSIHGSST
ncbi:MAG TPA: hypothetical protein VGC21_03605 [Telluria sp.]